MAKFGQLKRFLPYLLILAVSGLILTHNIQKPFYGHHDWNGAFYANIARNYLRYSLIKTKLGQVTNTGLHQPDQFSYYTHYPPLISLTLAFFLQTPRFMPVLFTIFSLIVFFQITQKLKFSKLASLTSLSLVFTPMLRYFGKMPSQEVLIVFFTLSSLYFYLTRQPKMFLITTVFNGLSGWAGYFLYPLLLLHSRSRLKAMFKTILQAICLLIFIFFLHLTHIYLLTGSFLGGGLLDALLLRLNLYQFLGRIPPELPGQFTWLNYLKKQTQWLTIYYTATLLLASLISLILIVKKLIKKTKLDQAEMIILLLLGWGLSYPVIFSNVVFVHEYFNIFFWPFLALSFGYLINRIKLKSKPLTLSLCLILATTIYFERNSFYQALNQTQAHQPGYNLGTLINQTVPPDQPAFVIVSDEFVDVQAIFIEFYADRQINFVAQPPSDSQFVFDSIKMLP